MAVTEEEYFLDNDRVRSFVETVRHEPTSARTSPTRRASRPCWPTWRGRSRRC